jgi:hypothetical protein
MDGSDQKLRDVTAGVADELVNFDGARAVLAGRAPEVSSGVG